MASRRIRNALVGMQKEENIFFCFQNKPFRAQSEALEEAGESFHYNHGWKEEKGCPLGDS